MVGPDHWHVFTSKINCSCKFLGGFVRPNFMGRSSNREELAEWLCWSWLYCDSNISHPTDECFAHKLGQMGRTGISDHFQYRCSSVAFVQPDHVHLCDVFLLHQLPKLIPSYDYDSAVSHESKGSKEFRWNIAKKMMCESYGLVFGVNGFIALVMQTILTVVISDKRGLGLPVRAQVTLYSRCHKSF